MYKLKKRTWVFSFFLATTILLIGLLPVISMKTPFYAVDPDPAYVFNSLKFLQFGKINFTDHPGTPLTIYLSAQFFIVKFVAKALLGVGVFTVWFIGHLGVMFWIAKLSVFAVLLFGTAFLFYIIVKQTSSLLAAFFLGLLLLSNSIFPSLPGSLNPEIFGFLFFSGYAYFLVKFINRERMDYLVIASVFSGLASTTKLSFLVLSATTVVLAIVYSYTTFSTDRLKDTFKFTIVIVGFSFAGFFLGTLPVVNNLDRIILKIRDLIIRKGNFGGGGFGLFDSLAYKDSIKLWFGERVSIIVLATFPLVLQGFSKRARKYWLSVILVAFFFFLAFMKFPQAHYQFANLLVISLVSTMVFSKIKPSIQLVILTIGIALVLPQVKEQYLAKKANIYEASVLQGYISDNFDNKDIGIFDVVKARQFFILRGNRWAGKSFAEEIEQVEPRIWQINHGDLSKITNPYGQDVSITNFCWNYLIIRKETWDRFVASQEKPELFIRKQILNTDYYDIKRTDCLSERGDKV